jgi:hypothetical protein
MKNGWNTPILATAAPFLLLAIGLAAASPSSAADLPITTGKPSVPTLADEPAKIEPAGVKSVKVDAAKNEAVQNKEKGIEEKAAEGKKTGDQKEAKKDGKKDGKAEPEKLSNDCCGHPGMIPVCRCVPVTKKKPKTEYEVKCELVCVPGCGTFHPKHPCDKHHGCSEAGCTSCCDTPCCDNTTIRKKKTLMKKVVDEEYDAWEYKIEWVCAPCAVGCCTAPGCCDGPDGCRTHGSPRLFGWLFHKK